MEKGAGLSQKGKKPSEPTKPLIWNWATTRKQRREKRRSSPLPEICEVFSNQKKFIEAQKKAAAAGALDKQPGLSSGNPMNGENVESSPVNAFRKGAGI